MSLLASVLRVAARLTGLAVAGLYFLMLIGEMTGSHSGPPTHWIEWAGIVLMTAACVAMVAAWRWELAGGSVSLAVLGVIAVLIHGSRTFHRSLLVMSIPGLLYAADWLVRSWEWNRHASR